MTHIKRFTLFILLTFVGFLANSQEYIWYSASYQFEDISTDDNNIVTQLVGDDNETSVEINLSNYFNFYGTDYPRIKIAVDGAITLNMSETHISYMNSELPNPSAPSLLIAPYWNDISNVDSESEIYYHTNSERAIVQWENMEILNSGGRISMQVVLKYSDNSITISYKDVSPDIPGNEQYATIGMQNSDGTEGIMLAYNNFFAEGFQLATEKTYKILIPEAYPPQMNPQSGTFTETISVEITSETPDAIIYYTTDGTEPTTSSTLYENPIEITQTTALKAIATKNAYISETVTENYFIISEGTAVEAGTIFGDWTVTGSPYYVLGNVEVPNGNCLTIEAGTEIFVTGNFKFEINGCINAIGTETEPIIFDKGFSADSWNGFNFLDYQGGTASSFDFCEFYNSKASENGGVFRVENWSELVISNSIFEQNFAENNGGAIYCNNADIELTDNTFTENSSENSGGAIYAENSEIIISQNIFENNFTENNGGGLAGSQLQNSLISENYFANNQAQSSISAGGGIALFGSNAEVVNNEIAENQAYSEGGGVILANSDNIFFAYNNIHHNFTSEGKKIKKEKITPQIYSQKNQYLPKIEKNNSPKGSGSGGGIQISGGTGLVASNRIEHNSTNFRGGGIYVSAGDIQINSNLIAYNFAADGGGGIVITGSDGPLANNSFMFNQSNMNGNAMLLTNSSPDIYNSLFWYNTGDGTYGDIFVNNDGSTPNFYNCSNIYGIDGIDGDFFGGWTFNGEFQNCTYNHPIYEIENEQILGLKEFSAMINAGAELPANIQLPEFDANGNQRTFDGTLDIGCFEYQQVPNINVLNGETVGTLTEGIYYAQSELTIPEGETLTIDAGTEIYFTGNHGIRVYGNIVANGTDEAPIKISVADSLGFEQFMLYTTGAWRNIAFFDCQTPSTFNYVNFEFSKVNNLFLEEFENNAGAVANIINSSPEFENCNFYYNFTYGAGGALAYFNTEDKGGKIINCKFEGNYSVSSHYMFENQGGRGGAIYLQNSSLEIVGSLFSQNFAIQGAGAGYGIGGAIYALNTQSKFVNNTFADNYSPNAGAFYTSETDEIELENSPVFVNNIFWNNQADAPQYGDQLRLDGNTENMQFLNNNIEGGLSQIMLGNDEQFYGTYTNNIAENPEFTAGYQLSDNSPCKDAGLADLSNFSIPQTDLAGNSRIVNETIDIGAYENQTVVNIQNIENQLIQIYPNPNNGIFSINSTQKIQKLEITDISGKIIFEKKNLSEKTNINLSNQNSGIYFAKIKTEREKEIITLKILIY